MKAVGLCLIFSCCLSLGFYSSYKTKTGLKRLREIIKFLNHIKTKIEFFSSTLEDIYNNYTSDDDTVNLFINDISKFGWSVALNNSKDLYLSEKAKSYLKDYGSFLGKSNKDEQIIHNDYYIRQLEEEYKLLESEAEKKIKLSLSLGIYIGLMLVILFI